MRSANNTGIKSDFHQHCLDEHDPELGQRQWNRTHRVGQGGKRRGSECQLDLTSYSADPDFTQQDEILERWKLSSVYLGNESGVDITGLLEDTEYHCCGI
jgi:hypothetical protein